MTSLRRPPRAAFACGVTIAATLALLAACSSSMAADQAPGPTWKINLDTQGERNAEGWTIAAPAVEVIYQWRPRLALTASSSWIITRPHDAQPISGLGSGSIGFNWLLYDDPANALSVELKPQVERALTSSSIQRGLASPNRAFALPVEVKFHVAGTSVEVLAGRTFIEADSDAWSTELKVIRPCLPDAECVLAAERDFGPAAAHQTLVAVGLEWKLSEPVTLKTSVGRQFGHGPGLQTTCALLLGLKIAY
jgi:hypothetical protein